MYLELRFTAVSSEDAHSHQKGADKGGLWSVGHPSILGTKRSRLLTHSTPPVDLKNITLRRKGWSGKSGSRTVWSWSLNRWISQTLPSCGHTTLPPPARKLQQHTCKSAQTCPTETQARGFYLGAGSVGAFFPNVD